MSTATAPAPASASEAMDMVHAGLTFLATADATAMGSAVQATLLRGLEEANSVAIGGADLDPGRVHRRAGLHRRRGLQPAGVADAPDRDHLRGGHRPYRVGEAGPGASPSARRPGRQGGLRTLGEGYLQVDRPSSRRFPGRGGRDLAGRGGVRSVGWRTWPALAGEMYERSRQHAPDGRRGPVPDGIRPGPGPGARCGSGPGRQDPPEGERPGAGRAAPARMSLLTG